MSIGGTELLIIVIFGFLLFGPDKLPEMGRTIGRALRQFRETQQRMTSMVQSEVIDPMAATINATAQPSSAASAAVAEDADADDAADDAPAPRKETFAERRARLAAEKAAAAPAEGDGTAEPAAAPAASAEEAPAEAAPAPGEVGSAQEAAPAEAEVRTTADLYARRPRKRVQADAASAGTDALAADAEAAEGGER